MMTETDALLILNAVGATNRQCQQLLEHFGSARNILARCPADPAVPPFISPKLIRKIYDFPKDKFLKSEYNLISQHGIKIVCRGDPGYPSRLSEIPDAPLVLYILGKVAALDSASIAVVGSRQASVYGLSIAERFAGQFSEWGLTVTSGLARGIDSAAHRGSLKARGSTVAVLGSGLANMYPPENEGLARQISAAGALVSEFPMEMPPLAYNFPRRNRIISGLALGVLVIEANSRSGALITADFALEQGREVFAVPGKIDQPGSHGVHQLIKQGAKLVMCAEDVLEELNPHLRNWMADARADAPCDGRNMNWAPLSNEAMGVYTLISDDPVYIDQILQQCPSGQGDVTRILFDLELQKKVRKLPGNYFVRTTAKVGHHGQ